MQGLLGRARVAIIDPGSASSGYELGAALGAPGPGNVIVVTDAPDALPANARAARVLTRSPNDLEDLGSLVADLGGLLGRFASEVEAPARLLSKGEGNGAVVAAWTELELRLARAVGNYSPPRRFAAAMEGELIPADLRGELDFARRLRNAVVHGHAQASMAEAERAVAATRRAVAVLDATEGSALDR